MSAKTMPLETTNSYEKATIVSAVASFKNAVIKTTPYSYWLFENALPLQMCKDIISLPLKSAGEYDTQGKRDSHNELRRFVSPELQQQYDVLADLAKAFQSQEVIESLEKLCKVSFSGSYLRIEYCQDKNGFWLEPHMDIKEKLVTIQIYLNTSPDAATLGTDIYNADKSHFGTAPSLINQGMIFVPKEPNSFHGFEKRTIQDTRKSLIINYVTDDWRARHELAFPNHKIT